MADYKIEGLTVAGRPVSGMISADNVKDAKQKASLMAVEKKFKLTGVYERVTWLYRVQKGTDKPIDGEQKAYTKDEVKQALEKMGYRVLYVRKKLFGNKQRAAPAVDIITFVRMSADLMRQKLPFNEILILLMNDIGNPALRDAVKEINSELKQGKDSEKVFLKQAPVFGKFTANMLGLASKSGNMTEIYESTAKFLERNAQFKRNLKSALDHAVGHVVYSVPCCAVLRWIYFPGDGGNVREVQNRAPADDEGHVGLQPLVDGQFRTLDDRDLCSDRTVCAIHDDGERKISARQVDHQSAHRRSSASQDSD